MIPYLMNHIFGFIQYDFIMVRRWKIQVKYSSNCEGSLLNIPPFPKLFFCMIKYSFEQLNVWYFTFSQSYLLTTYTHNVLDIWYLFTKGSEGRRRLHKFGTLTVQSSGACAQSQVTSVSLMMQFLCPKLNRNLNNYFRLHVCLPGVIG